MVTYQASTTVEIGDLVYIKVNDIKDIGPVTDYYKNRTGTVKNIISSYVVLPTDDGKDSFAFPINQVVVLENTGKCEEIW